MVKTCCVKNCDIAPKGNVTCFRFPNNRFLKRKWIDAIGLSNKLTANSTVCIKHFQEDDYDIVRGRPRLKAKVIPSVFSESDKLLLSSNLTEDVILIEENTNITLNNIHLDNLNTPEGSTELQNDIRPKLLNEGKTKSQSHGSAVVNNGSSTEMRNECSTDVQKESSANLQKEGDAKLNTKDGKDLHKEGSTVSQNKNTAELHSDDNTQSNNIDNADVQNETSSKYDTKKNKNEDSKQNEKENVEEVQKNRKIKSNGVILKEKINEKGYQDSFIESTTKSSSNVDDLNKDIEDIIVNYQIKQTRPVHGVDADRTDRSEKRENGVERAAADAQGLLKENDPVFIEVAVQGDRAGSPRDCLMVLESVQVELDPSTFLADGEPDDCHETVDLADDDDHDDHCGKRPDPISLLTSSDEDEVIIQEPHIDTVEVSDETDEDDVPLVKLLKQSKKKKKANISLWNAYEYFCMDCQYTATSKQEYRAHTAKHSTILQVCEICDYTSASKIQFSKHKRKHRDERKFKCHLCDYRARHNMGLAYHLKSHRDPGSVKKDFKCGKCGFKSDVKTVVLKHVKLCASNDAKYSCDKCEYQTKRPSDLKRHKARRHDEDRDDDEEFVP